MHTSLDVYALDILSARIFYRGVPDCATDSPCGVWCRGFTTCLLYVGPLFGNVVWNDSRFVSLTQWRTTISLFLLWFYIYLNVSQYDNTLLVFTLFSCLKYCCIFYIVFWYSILFHIDVTLALSMNTNILHCRGINTSALIPKYKYTTLP